MAEFDLSIEGDANEPGFDPKSGFSAPEKSGTSHPDDDYDIDKQKEEMKDWLVIGRIGSGDNRGSREVLIQKNKKTGQERRIEISASGKVTVVPEGSKPKGNKYAQDIVDENASRTETKKTATPPPANKPRRMTAQEKRDAKWVGIRSEFSGPNKNDIVEMDRNTGTKRRLKWNAKKMSHGSTWSYEDVPDTPPESSSGIEVKPLKNKESKKGDQLGLIEGEGKRRKFKNKIKGSAPAKQASMFGSSDVDPDQMDMFGGEGIPDELVASPKATSMTKQSEKEIFEAAQETLRKQGTVLKPASASKKVWPDISSLAHYEQGPDDKYRVYDTSTGLEMAGPFDSAEDAADETLKMDSELKEILQSGYQSPWTEEEANLEKIKSLTTDPDEFLNYKFERGSIFGKSGEYGTAVSYAKRNKNKNLGKLVDILKITEEQDAMIDYDSPFLPVQLNDDHPRKIKYRHRMELKSMLPKKLQSVITKAKKLSQKEFLPLFQEGGQFSGMGGTIEEKTGLDLKEFWRQVRKGPNPDKPIGDTSFDFSASPPPPPPPPTSFDFPDPDPFDDDDPWGPLPEGAGEEKVRNRGRKPRTKIDKQIADLIGSPHPEDISNFKSVMERIRETHNEGIEAENAPLLEALSASGIKGAAIGPFMRSWKKLGDSKRGRQDYNDIPGFDEIAKTYQYLSGGDPTHISSDEALAKALNKGILKTLGPRSEELMQMALGPYQHEFGMSSTPEEDDVPVPEEKPSSSLSSEQMSKIIDSIKGMAPESGSTTPPPPPPPAPPGGGEPPEPPGGDGGDGEGPPPEDPKKLAEVVRREKELKKKKAAKEFADLKRKQARDRATEAETSRYQTSLLRKQIRSEAKEASTQIEAAEGSSASDRIIRRLGSFGMARGIGQSGQMFAALTEMLVFRPEEMAADQLQRQIREEAAKEEERKITELEENMLRERLANKAEKERVEDILNDAKLRMDFEDDPDRKAEIIEEARKAIDQGKPVVAELVGGGGTTPPPSSPPTTPPSPGGGSGGGKPQSMVNKALGAFGEGLQDSTKLILAANIAIEGMNLVSKSFTEEIKALGSVLAQDVTNFSSAPMVSLAGSTGRNAASVAGAGAGTAVGVAAGRAAAATAARVATTAVGTAATGPVGLLAGLVGFGVGKGAADAVTEPIVSAIQVGNEIMENYTNNSIGFETISANVEQEMLTFLQKMSSDAQLDPITAEFAEARGELSRAVLSMQNTFISHFGDDLTAIIRLLAIIAEGGSKLASAGTSLADTVVSNSQGPFPTIYRWYQRMVSLLSDNLDTQNEIAKLLSDEFKDNGKGFMDEVESFFSTQPKGEKGEDLFKNETGFF